MSWFDASGFASLAKSALKEAQKTIDKALDIKDEEQKVVPASSGDNHDDFFATWGLKAEEDRPEKKDDKSSASKQQSTSLWGSFTGSFFDNPEAETGAPLGSRASKNVLHSNSLPETSESVEKEALLPPSTSVSEDLMRQNYDESKSEGKHKFPDSFDESDSFKRGSDTFAEPSRRDFPSPVEWEHSKAPSESNRLEDPVEDSNHGGLDEGHLAVDANKDKWRDVAHKRDFGRSKDVEERDIGERRESIEEIDIENDKNVKSREPASNRISIVSSGSDKKSSESFEVLDSRSNTDCTTSPDSDVNSISNSISSCAVGAKGNSESVEILPDSVVTSPSSVEILGDWKSDEEPFASPMDRKQFEASVVERSESITPYFDGKESRSLVEHGRHAVSSHSDISPYESPLEEAKTLNISPDHRNSPSPSISPVSSTRNELTEAESDKISPESVEVIPDVYESDEVSLAEDSYTSASESTVMTIREQVEPSKAPPGFVDRTSSMHDSCPESRHMSSKLILDSPLHLSLDSLKEKPDLHLPIEPITTQPVRKAEHLESAKKPSDSDLSEQFKISTVESLRADGFCEKSEEDEIPIESSSGERETAICEAERKAIEAPLVTSAHAKHNYLDSQSGSSLNAIKEMHNLHRPIEPITVQPFRKLEHRETARKISELDPFEQLKCSTIEPPDPDAFYEKTEVNETQEQPVMLTDSSCEGTLIESSSEENATLVCEVERKIVETPLTASSYVKNMLADAMVEKGEVVDLERHCMDVPRENSPISSESRSDLVKIGSDQTTSGHTSGDELETTTSSDIEIISSPNGDSSSTQSRQSPAKPHSNKSSDLLTKTLNKVRGHSRELSEISVGSDDANVEVEKLLRRIQEMTEILEARESKLIDVSRMNMELHEQNNNLKKQLDSIEKRAEQNQDLTQITDEYTQRLSALERKFQQAIKERDTLRKQMEQLKQEAATRLSSQEMSTMNAEKDEIIRELREEGEKLSKQQLQHSNIIKKLRAKEKENDSVMKNQKEQIDEQSLELERLKRSMYAKEEVERSQIEAVHTLTAKTKKQEKEIHSLQEKLDDALQKMETYKRSLDGAKTELAETKQNLADAEEELKEAIENAGESCHLSAQVAELKARLRQDKEAHIKREETLKQENNDLMKRLEVVEAKGEELSESVSMATKPLLRQLEQLQANLSHKSSSFMKQEKMMSEKIIELQTKLETAVEMNSSLKEDNLSLKSKVSGLEAKLNSKEMDRTKLREHCEEIQLDNERLAAENKEHRQTIEMLEQSHANKVKELKREINSLENKLSFEKAATDAEKRKNHAILEQQQSVEDELRLSPTLSIGRESVSSSNSVWPSFGESMFESGSGRFPNIYESMKSGSNSTSMFENLQAQLKQRDGEVQQLQWELSRRNIERDALNMELSSLSLKVEELSAKVSQVEALNESLSDIQTRYDALLQMYGEKVEENQELRLDLQDVKDMYKSQIDQLLKRDV